ncbi:hypothetical protein [Streptomyces sp. NPDC002232]|uniref:hypothetical protein n=1 Tax=Streptomyces sp. NPDC002232 TaxID=3364640 RepID=UPI0036931EEA
MRILLVAGSFDGLTQRVLAELSDRGHAVAVEVAPDGSAVREAVTRHAPDLVVARRGGPTGLGCGRARPGAGRPGRRPRTRGVRRRDHPIGPAAGIP